MTVGLSLLSVTAVSLVSLLGLVAISMSEARTRRVAAWLVSFAAGALLGDAFIHLIPATFEAPSEPLGPSLLILGGMMLFFVVEKLLRRQQHYLAAINLMGDGIHNFIDGALIAVSYMAGPTLGISTTIAVLLHEIPQEFADFGILIHSGLTPRRAVRFNLASASTALLGNIVALAAGTFAGNAMIAILLPATAGGFVYLAAADLIPEMHHDCSFHGLLGQTVLMSAGIGLMAVLAIFE